MVSKGHTTIAAAEMAFDEDFSASRAQGLFTLFYGGFRVNTLTYGGKIKHWIWSHNM